MAPELNIQVDKPNVPTNTSSGVFTVAEIEPGEQKEAAIRHLAICLDVSKSMEWDNKIDKAQEGLKRVLGLLNEDDYLSIVTFSSQAKVDLDAQRWGDLDPATVRNQIDSFDIRGGTDIYTGLQKARDTLVNLPEGENVVKEILLVTDGEDNEKEAPDFEGLATETNKSYNMSVVAAGVGDDYDQPTVKTIGENSAGRWEHIGGADELLQFMGEEVDMMESTIVANPELKIDAASGVELTDVKRRIPQVQEVDVYQDGGKPTVDLPNLQENEKQKVTMEINVPSRDEGDHQIAVFELDTGSETIKETLTLTYTDDQSLLAQQNMDPYLEYKDTVVRSEISEGNLDEADTVIDEMEAVAGEDTEIVSAAIDTKTKVENADSDEEELEAIGSGTKVPDK
jgi:Ca-activated chloride channel family protein